MLALLLLAAVVQPPAGAWRVERIERAPWATGAPDRRLADSRLRFLPRAVRAPRPFGCGRAGYARARLPAEGLFQGALGEGAAAAARRLGIAVPAETVSVSCDSGLFDYHRVGERLVTALDNDLYWLVRDGD